MDAYGPLPVGPEEPTPHERACYNKLRLQRFFNTFIGYHKGDLDSRGRWETRYSSLYTRMLRLLQDVNKHRAYLTAVATRSQHPHDKRGKNFMILSPTVKKYFEKKYELVYFDVNLLLDGADRVNALLMSNSQPIFQRLLLLHLPPEVLSHALGFIDIDDAKCLAATCRAFRELAAPYAFRTRRLTLRCRDILVRRSRQDETEHAAYSSALYHYSVVSRDRFVDDCEFLLSRNDVLKHIRTLIIVNEWTEQHIEDTEWRDGRASFTVPVRQCIVKVLRLATNATDVLLQNVGISANMVTSMTKMTQLRTLCLSGCSRPQWTTRNPRPVLSVKNLIIDKLGSGDRGMVTITRFFPRVKTLVLKTGPQHMLCIPSSQFLESHNPFLSVGRLHVENICGHDKFVRFVACLRAAAQGSLPLTHLMIAQGQGRRFDRGRVDMLLAALRGTSLKVLALSGLGYVGEDLFVGLAEAVPALSALTLIFRQHIRQSEHKTSRWPGTTYQYASYLAAFPRLKVFAWNYHLGSSYGSFPSDIRIYEDQSIRSISVDDADEYMLRRLPYDAQRDNYECLARLFLVYAPALRSLCFFYGSGRLRVEYRMATNTAGEVTVKAMYEPKNDKHISHVFPAYYPPRNPRNHWHSWVWT